MTTEPARNACLARYFPKPLRLAEPPQHRRAPLQAAPLVLHRQVLFLHLLWVTEMCQQSTKYIILPTYLLLRWPVLRRHVLMDAAAAALDARRLQTFANTGDCAAWVNRNPGVDERCGTNALLIAAVDQQTRGTHNNSRNVGQITRETRHTPASAPRGRPMLRDAMSPSERSLHSQRLGVASGTPSAAAIFLLPNPRVAMRSMAKRFSVDRTMLL